MTLEAGGSSTSSLIYSNIISVLDTLRQTISAQFSRSERKSNPENMNSKNNNGERKYRKVSHGSSTVAPLTSKQEEQGGTNEEMELQKRLREAAMRSEDDASDKNSKELSRSQSQEEIDVSTSHPIFDEYLASRLKRREKENVMNVGYLKSNVSFSFKNAIEKDNDAKNLKPHEVEVSASFKRPLVLPVIAPSQLFNVKLKHNQRPETESESARKKLKFNKTSNDISTIYPNLCISGDKMARSWDDLQAKNVKYILNLAPSVCKNYFETKDNSLVYRKISLIDSLDERSILWAILRAFEFIDRSSDTASCFVHCHQGVSRSATIVIAYVMFKEKLEFRDAFDVVKTKHVVAAPNAGFIAQLIGLQQRFGFGSLSQLESQQFENELFLVSRHSAKDEEIILRSISSDPVEFELDARGTFLVYSKSPDVFYVWQGLHSEAKAQSMVAALEYIALLKKYFARYQSSKTIRVQTNFLEDPETDFTQMFPTCDANVKVSKYDELLTLSSTSDVGAGNLSARLEQLHMFDSPSLAWQVRLFKLNCDDRPFLEELLQYDADDLTETDAAVLLVDHSPEKSAIKAFIWLGKNIEDILNRDSVLKTCNEFIAAQKLGVGIDCEIQTQGHETAEFLSAFESGL